MLHHAGAGRNQDERLEEASKAELIVEREAQACLHDLSNDEISPTISSLSQKLHAIKQHELDKTIRKHPTLSPEAIDAFTRCADAIVAKILHTPIHELKSYHDRDAKEDSKSKVNHFIETLSALFHLD